MTGTRSDADGAEGVLFGGAGRRIPRPGARTARSGARSGAADGADGADPGDVPLLAEVMPWSVPALRLGRGWVMAPDPGSLTARWERLVRAEGAERAELFGVSRARTPQSAVPALPGQATGTGRFAREREDGRCPEPVRIAHGPFDQQWLIPDHRLIDAARPELWRVADAAQLFAVEQGYGVRPGPEPAVLVSALLPDGRSPAGPPARIRPLYRRPGGREPNLAPGLTALLAGRLGRPVTAEEVVAWAVAVAAPSPAGAVVPFTADPGVWARGVALGRRLTSVQLRGAHGGDRPRLPGGRRPYVRAAVPERPEALTYDAAEEVLRIGTGRISPVPAGAWEFTAGGARTLETWFEGRTRLVEPPAPGTLEAIRPSRWPQEWTSELLELITVLALLAEARPEQARLRAEIRTAAGASAGAGARTGSGAVGRAELRAAGVLPVPSAARRPASVLDHHEEGPEGQFALV